MVVGEFVAIGTPLDGDGFVVSDAAVSLVGCELVRTEVEDAGVSGTGLVAVFADGGFWVMVEVVAGVGGSGIWPSEATAITSTGMKSLAARKLLRRAISQKRSIPKTNKWITRELKITIAHSPGGSE